MCFPDACSPGLCPKYRRQIFDHDATEKPRTYFSDVCADFEAELVEMDGEPDHVHLLINYPPKLAISSLVNSLKGVSEVRQYPSSANTLNNSKHLVRWKTAPYIPALKDGVLRRTG
nr:IS200/IS605 family transposase [Escherichia coli]